MAAEPRLVQQGVGLVQAVEVRRFSPGEGGVGLGPPPDEGPVLRGAVGGKIPQDLGFHRDALVNKLIHDLPVEAGDGGAFVGHDLDEAVLLQALQHHPDEGAGRTEPGAERILAQQSCPGRRVRSMISRSSTA